jgi:threonine dehydrogenase-like Zn-dependent dehydrogenase
VRWTVEKCRAYLLEAMASGRMDLSPLITDRVSPRELPEVMDRLDRGTRSGLAVVLDWRSA